VGLTNLQNVFNQVIAGETLTISFATKASYDSCRASLLRKFRNHKSLFDSLGADNPYEHQFIQCTFDKELVRGKFQLVGIDQRTNTPNSKLFHVEQL